ncbi:hypothetical protein L596_018253 [Steinernema carpocapsae]|uniref:Uncharacterized protein n=1 Tax=Steinernema carpocapsae TaxID=34508 RepID=A0A4U5N4U8_STECR|nr:hypothetical protein L596_018253 [Steinernema carpocapsae]
MDTLVHYNNTRSTCETPEDHGNFEPKTEMLRFKNPRRKSIRKSTAAIECGKLSRSFALFKPFRCRRSI